MFFKHIAVNYVGGTKNMDETLGNRYNYCLHARLAQSVEHETLNLRVVGSSPTLGVIGFKCYQNL